MTLDNPTTAPAPVGPYSQLARVDVDGGALLFVSGQIAVDAAGELVGGDSMTEQTRCVFDNIAALLAAHDSTKVTLRLDYEPEGMTEKAGDMLKIVESRVQGDLKRFKKFIESRGTETGAWRGEVKPSGEVQGG